MTLINYHETLPDTLPPNGSNDVWADRGAGQSPRYAHLWPGPGVGADEVVDASIHELISSRGWDVV